jgi:mRNA-degrading endonuclease RelE of RelBE toxin-antitoxin system
MISNYKVLVTLKSSIKLQELRKPIRFSILSFLTYLETNPFERGDQCLYSTEHAREYSMKAIRQRIIIYYVDHANKEIRVLDLKHIDEV